MVADLVVLFFLLYGMIYVISNFKSLLGAKKAVSPSSERWPIVAVIAPYKGIEPEMENNLASLFSQDYPSSFEIIFVTQSEDDPAYGVIRKFLASRPDVRAKLVTAGEAVASNQKLSNQLRALREVSKDTEVLTFIDSDLRVSPMWLRSLVAPLDHSGVGATTGYRLFRPQGKFWDSVCALWDSVNLLALSYPRISFPWGGSMAMRCELFRQLDVARIWRKSLTDDLSLGRVLREKGFRITFSPLACGITPSPSSLSEFWRWATRQMIMVRLYMRRLWIVSLLGLVFYHLALIGSGFLWVSGGWLRVALPTLLLSRVVGILLRKRAVEILSAGNIRWHLFILLLDPLMPTLSLFLWFAAWRAKEIEWRGIIYCLNDYR